MYALRVLKTRQESIRKCALCVLSIVNAKLRSPEASTVRRWSAPLEWQPCTRRLQSSGASWDGSWTKQRWAAALMATLRLGWAFQRSTDLAGSATEHTQPTNTS